MNDSGITNGQVTDVVDLPNGSVFILTNSDGSYSENPSAFLVSRGYGSLDTYISSYDRSDERSRVIVTSLRDMKSYVHKRGQGFTHFKVVPSSLTLTT